MNHYLEEFCRTTEELLGSDAVRMMGRWKHHGHISTLDHSLFVARSLVTTGLDGAIMMLEVSAFLGTIAVKNGLWGGMA